MSSRNPQDLSEDTKARYLNFDAAMRVAGIDYILTCTYRSDEEQTALYAQGRTAPGSIVTNAQAGQSAHNCEDPAGNPAARAFDVVPVVNGKPDWDGSHPVWEQVGKIGEAAGLEWAGRWKSFKEKPHFQLSNWKQP
jgi:peptidoglycan L-alanyl-D-glutamate endopeptidase CwlK